MEYEPVIGLEVHVQLATNTKAFARAPYSYGQEPNTQTDPTVLALPGALPVLNIGAIQKSIQTGLLFGCTIAPVCHWDRKNYFYPDLPKGYQISQNERPICVGGSVEIELPGPARNIMGEHRQVALHHIHLEEDAGKLNHAGNKSLVDYNRAGAALIEIVTEPDLFSSEEVFAFLTAIKTSLLYAGISSCDMEKGHMRCDANISLRPKGSKKLGTRIELKNLNSISNVRRGVEYEIARQTKILQEGGTITQATRKWNAENNTSIPLRDKEEAHDYRYFPDPDLMPVRIPISMLTKLKNATPELPFDKQRRFMESYELPYTVTSVLCMDKPLSDYFETALLTHDNPKALANLITNDLLRDLSTAGKTIVECPISPASLAELVKAVDSGIITKQTGQDVFIEMFNTGHTSQAIIKAKGLKIEEDLGALEVLCQEAIDNNPKAVTEFKAGKDTAINVLKGQVMKVSKGKANPASVDKVLRKLLG